MSGESTAAAPHRTFIVEPASPLSEALRYAGALVIVAMIGGGVLAFAGRSAPPNEASEIDSAVLIDLPAAEASSQPAHEAADGPEQQAMSASSAQSAPPRVEPPKVPDKPAEETKPAPAQAVVDHPPPPVAPDPAAVLERKQEEAPPPKPVAAPATPAQNEQAPAGAQNPTKTDDADSDEGQPHASAHAITSWQKSLMRRLEAARRLAGRETLPSGSVKIGFAIDGKGTLASERVVKSSGSSTLDRAALALVRQAAPFPAPPPGAADRDTSFVVPIRFR